MKPYLRRELGRPIDQCFAHFQSKPIAAGSVGQVYGATLPQGLKVAVKVLRPDIEAQVKEDGRLLRKVAALAASTSLGSQVDFVGLADQVLAALERELDFRIEAENTRRLQRCLEQSAFVPSGRLRLPQVVDELSGQRVLALEWIEGEPILAPAARTALENGPGVQATDLLEQIAPPAQEVKVDRQLLLRQLDQLIASNFSKPLEELNFALFLADLLQLANRTGLRVPGTMGLFVKSVTNLEGVGCTLNPKFSFTGEMQPLVAQLLARSLLLPQERLMQFGLDLRNLSIDSPRQLNQLLRRFSSDDLVFALQLEGLESLRKTLDRLSQRVALAILVAALLLSATLMASLAQQDLLRDVSEGLFIGANLFGLWLLVSLLRSSRR